MHGWMNAWSTGVCDADGRRDATRRRTVAMAPFLGGMRGLTVFVQDVRNCSNKVRIDLDFFARWMDDATRATRMNE